jgi:putative Mg2+ transporter-C (MgtC) family protein
MLAEPFSTYVMRLLIALAIGGAIGLEREFKGKPAGIRTNMLMCFGACLIMIISIEVARMRGGTADPGRIAAQVVTGIGFLGAGTIIRSRFHVAGLTTAATIWVLSALGLAVGAGYLLLAVVGGFLITLTLTLIGYVEKALKRRHGYYVVQLDLESREGIIGAILELFSELNIHGTAQEINRSGANWTAIFDYYASLAEHKDLLAKLSSLGGVKSITEI